MAIYHAQFQVIGRSAGRSATAAAAYRAGESITDTRTGIVHDYSRKRGVDAAFILTPSDAPSWAADRAQLWNNVEQSEKRKDAQLCRELNVAIPIELPHADRIQLVEDYVQSTFVDQGMIADVCFHDLDTHNPHAHVMLTMRELDGEVFGKKNRDWNSKELLVEWREKWAVAANKQLQASGEQVSIDHRSLADQGIERLPGIKLGPAVSAMEKRGIRTERGDRLRRIHKINETLKNISRAIRALPSRTRNEFLEARTNLLDTLSAKGSLLGAAVQRKESQDLVQESKRQNDLARRDLLLQQERENARLEKEKREETQRKFDDLVKPVDRGKGGRGRGGFGR